MQPKWLISERVPKQLGASRLDGTTVVLSRSLGGSDIDLSRLNLLPLNGLQPQEDVFGCGCRILKDSAFIASRP